LLLFISASSSRDRRKRTKISTMTGQSVLLIIIYLRLIQGDYVEYVAKCDPMGSVQVVCCPPIGTDGEVTLHCKKKYGENPDSKHFKGGMGTRVPHDKDICDGGHQPLAPDDDACKAATNTVFPKTKDQCLMQNDCKMVGRESKLPDKYPRTQEQVQKLVDDLKEAEDSLAKLEAKETEPAQNAEEEARHMKELKLATAAKDQAQEEIKEKQEMILTLTDENASLKQQVAKLQDNIQQQMEGLQTQTKEKMEGISNEMNGKLNKLNDLLTRDSGESTTARQ